LNQASARALVIYLQRAYALIPSTLAEVDAMRPATSAIEAIANGHVTATLAPVIPPDIVSSTAAPEARKE
jgi:hypothetical protein